MGTIAEDTRFVDATEQAAMVRRKDVTAVELVQAAIERIEAIDPALNAVNYRWFDDALAAAADPALPDGPFRGVPFLVKDLAAHIEGRPLSNGNVRLKELGRLSSFSTTLVQRFDAAGLVTLGRTASPEWGSVAITEPVAWGPTRNPWNTGRSPGGSSGGAGAAVAAGMVPVAHASDGGGSIRIPASCCGLVGLKVSQGRTSMGPIRVESGFSVEHAVTRTVRDSAALLDATCGRGVGDLVSAPAPSRPFLDEVGADPGRLRIGVLDHSPRGHTDPQCTIAARRAAELLAGLGHTVDAAWPAPLDDQSFSATFSAVWTTGSAMDALQLAHDLGRPLEDGDIEPMNAFMAGIGRERSATDYASALAAVAAFRRQVHAWWEVDGWDLLVSPTLATEPLPIGTASLAPAEFNEVMVRSSAFTSPFNVSGQPAISLPLHWTPEGVPIGVQLVAAYGREDLLLRVAAQLESAAPWSTRHPPI